MRRVFRSRNDAEGWIFELEEYSDALKQNLYPVATWLTPDQVRDAEMLFAQIPESVRVAPLARYVGVKGSERNIEAALDEFLAAKRTTARRRARTVQNLRIRIRQCIGATGMRRAVEFDQERIEDFLSRPDVVRRTVRNDRAALHNFGTWLVRQHYLTENPVARIEPTRPEWTPPSIMRPEDAERLMLAALGDELTRGKTTGWWAVCLFGGLRPEAEAPYLMPELVDLDNPDLRLREMKVVRSKLAEAPARSVPISDNLAAWLRLCRARGWWIEPPSRKAFSRIRKTAGVLDAWAIDIMRHSFATYWLAADLGNRSELADVMGNSPNVIRQRYENVAARRKGDGPKFWAIVPPGPEVVEEKAMA